MELDDINSVNPIGDHETSLYENSKITSATLEKTENSQPKQTENVEGLYETLTLERKSNDRKTLTLLEKDTIKRIKGFIFVILALVIVLYIGIIALTIVVTVPKAQDGGWSNWETWSSCSDSCGGGIKSRNRSCSNPAPSFYGKQCIGNFEQLSLCNKQLCHETDGGWSSWETWSSCSDSCGGGIKSRNRSCSNPVPSLDGKQCIGNFEQLSLCNKQLCNETDGGWSNWETWNICTDSCGGGIKSRNRSCSNPAPSLHGRQCIGNSEKAIQCNKQMCPGTDGGWSSWVTLSSCSDSCGGGIKSRNRSCSNPVPSLDGKQCIGNFEQLSLCNKQLCNETDGGWSNWETWNACTDSCGGGIKSRNRSCSNPAPSLHGRQCIGNSEQAIQCNKQMCPGTDGGWSSWETLSSCSDSCGGGIKSRNRSCSNQVPSLYGKNCIGNFEQLSLCNKQLCNETDGGWSNWETWNICTDSCGGGIKSRNRSCSNPAPSVIGKQCLGNSEQAIQCNKQMCPGTDGGWSNWETWGTCSDSCGGGIKSRNRSCSNPAPSLYGKQCIGNSEQLSLCNKQLCRETDGGWSNWETWSACTGSCGGGVKARNRSCSNPTPSMHGKQCLGNYEQFSQCNKQLCPGTDGGWTVWEDWGACSDSCGGGIRTRSRSCTNPIPSMNGRHCTGDYTDVSTCNKTACSEHSVAFTAYDMHKNSSDNSNLLFRRTYINIGDGYDTATGKFTCSISGVYHFVVTLTKDYKDINYMYAYLRINGITKLYLIFNPKDDASNEVGAYMMTGAGTFHLNQSDVVYVYGVPNYFYYGQYSYFTGFLITPDQ